jgi:predicted DNA-binding transcriptional regulator YafY
MARATHREKTERLNAAWRLRQQLEATPAAAEQLMHAYGLSRRQAYRYLNDARRLRKPVPVAEVKVPFTVKLSRGLVDRLRAYAASTGLKLSDIVSRAVLGLLNRRGGRG